MVPSSLWVVLSLTLSFASASPLEESVLHRRQSITELTPEQVAAYRPYTYYAGAAGCEPSTTLNWTCGTRCEANPDFKPVASGGNGDSVQFWYVGYDPNLDTIIVGHQGTDFSKLLPILTDVNIILSNLDGNLFPGISSDITVHSGFKESQADTAEDVLSYVKITMSTYSTNSVTVGNQAFADYVDANVNVSHVNNKKDPVPILPWREIGYHHCSGEKHITDSNEWVNCPGQDNPDEQCIVGEVGNLLESNATDHSGPYDGIILGGC
ncbi:alpha/beta-hydrolase [Armillaria mellea]|nr:alpha/beta-hydrolase [Armillaria mellea]